MKGEGKSTQVGSERKGFGGGLKLLIKRRLFKYLQIVHLPPFAQGRTFFFSSP